MYIPLTKPEYLSMARNEQKADQPKFSYDDLGDQLDAQIESLPKNVHPVIRDHLNAARELVKAVAGNQQ